MKLSSVELEKHPIKFKLYNCVELGGGIESESIKIGVAKTSLEKWIFQKNIYPSTRKNTMLESYYGTIFFDIKKTQKKTTQLIHNTPIEDNVIKHLLHKLIIESGLGVERASAEIGVTRNPLLKWMYDPNGTPSRNNQKKINTYFNRLIYPDVPFFKNTMRFIILNDQSETCSGFIKRDKKKTAIFSIFQKDHYYFINKDAAMIFLKRLTDANNYRIISFDTKDISD